MKPRGLYESLLTQALADILQQLPTHLRAVDEPLSAADAADRVGLHIGRAIQKALEDLPDHQRVAQGIELANRLLDHMGALADATAGRLTASILRAIVGRRPDGTPEEIPSPLIPLLDTALLTNAPGEPRVGSQIRAELHSADRIDVVMAFIRRSGIAPLLDALRTHCDAGRSLRVLTTTYTDSTEGSALDDGLPILDLFDGRIAAELRLWDAIDEQRLSPFSYFGIHDGMDLRNVPWRGGRGYDDERSHRKLPAIIYLTDQWVQPIFRAWIRPRLSNPPSSTSRTSTAAASFSWTCAGRMGKQLARSADPITSCISKRRACGSATASTPAQSSP